jgi:hypothetical protein
MSIEKHEIAFDVGHYGTGVNVPIVVCCDTFHDKVWRFVILCRLVSKSPTILYSLM